MELSDYKLEELQVLEAKYRSKISQTMNPVFREHAQNTRAEILEEIRKRRNEVLV